MSHKVLDTVIRVGVHQGVRVYEFGDFVAERIPAHLIQDTPDRELFVAKDEQSENTMYPLADHHLPAVRAYFLTQQSVEQ